MRRLLLASAAGLLALALGASTALAGTEVGGTTISGGAYYTGGLGVTCTATDWHFDTGVPFEASFAVGDQTYHGFFGFWMKSSANCESIALGSGSLTAGGFGASSPTNTLSCESFAGTYRHTDAAFEADLSGPCTVNGSTTVEVTAHVASTWAYYVTGWQAGMNGTLAFYSS